MIPPDPPSSSRLTALSDWCRTIRFFKTGSELWRYRGDKIMLQFQVVYTLDVEIASQMATKNGYDLHVKNDCVNRPL